MIRYARCLMWQVLRQRYYNQLEWDRAKQHFINDVLAESRARRNAGRRWP